jgi:hypothetical protein
MYCTPWTVSRSPLVFGNSTSALPSLWLLQPSLQDGECRFSDRRTSFLAPLADDAQVSTGSKDKIRKE